MKASKVIKYIVWAVVILAILQAVITFFWTLWAVVILAILNYCQELNDCLMRY